MKSRQDIGALVTIVATEAISKQRFVTATGAHTADKRAAGVSLFAADSGSEITVQCNGVAVVEAAEGITAGDLVNSDANGKAESLTLSAAADAEKICGVALDTASDAGDYIRVILK